MDARQMTLASVTDARIGCVSIAIAILNPKHAPCGKRAEDALPADDLWDKVEPKRVYGEKPLHRAVRADRQCTGG
jgi:molybdate transport system substrate-binding protein